MDAEIAREKAAPPPPAALGRGAAQAARRGDGELFRPGAGATLLKRGIVAHAEQQKRQYLAAAPHDFRHLVELDVEFAPVAHLLLQPDILRIGLARWLGQLEAAG